MSFEEYAALARQLSAQHRAGEQHAAAESARRRDLHAAVDYLQQRLTAQGQRLDQLGRAIGVDQPPPAPGPGTPGETAAWPGPPSGSGAPTAPSSGPPFAAGAPTMPGTGDGEPAGAPGRAGVGAYPQLPAGEARLALPTAVSPAGGGVPAQRAASADPAVELELARRMADEADRHGQQAELLAQRPALLPTWSPLARAVAVYAGCGAAAGVLVLILVLASGVGLVDGFTLGAWICAGLPAVAFFGGYLVLGRWGRPAMVAGTPPRYLPLGFLICFLVVPMAYCAYLLMVRGLR
ncbi:hypothetical protein MED15_02526 [Micromonospora noduli]|uniref:Uncharacterized protein n=1 Tax=Micromonospora noduli TaxID=709876 RepID=A0ABX9D3P1_9ACTN|nr:hypothetical protein [Micromonospora noduli]RAO20224.1 hypothetical protein MED15_02526 [Micromonospora noduli]RAO21844.1 hypothetical protein LUPAC07_01114 [Micromonospora noduli]